MTSRIGGASNSKLTIDIKDLTSSSITVQTYIAQLLQQADINLPQLNVSTHQHALRLHAYFWQSTFHTSILTAVADLNDVSNLYSALYPTFSRQVTQILNGDTNAITQLADGLDLFAKTASHKESTTAQLLMQLEKFSTEVKSDYMIFAADETQASQKITGPTGVLATYAKELDGVYSAIQKDVDLMAKGGVDVGIGIVEIFIGACATYNSGGKNTSVLTGGIGSVGKGINEQISGSLDYTHQVEKLLPLIEKIAAINQDLTVLKTIKHQLSGFDITLSINLVVSLQDVKKSWGDLKNQVVALSQTIKSINVEAPPPFLRAVFDDAKKNWDDAIKVTHSVLWSKTGIPVKSYPSIKDVIPQKVA